MLTERHLEWCGRVACWAGWVVFLVGLAVLIGWVFDVTALKSPITGLPAMKVNTALALMLAAPAAVFPQGRAWAAPTVTTSLAAAAIGGATLVEHLLGVNLGLDQMVMADNTGEFVPGRMSAVTAYVFVALGAAALLLRFAHESLRLIASVLALASAVMSALALAAYVGSVQSGIPIPIFASMAPHTAVIQFVLSVAFGCRFVASMTDLRSSRLRSMLVSSNGTVAAIAILVWGAISWLDYRDTVRAAETSVTNLARTLEEHARRSLDPADMALRRLADRILQQGMDDVAASREDWLYFKSIANELPQVSSIGFLDAAGDLQLLTTTFPLSPTNYAHRDYYKAHAAGAETRLGPVIVSGITGKRIFTFSRRLSDRTGQFLGVLFVSMDAEYFREFYTSVGLLAGGDIALYRADGLPLVGEPMPEIFAGLDASGLAPFKEHIHQRPAGLFAGPSPLDGTERLAAYRVASDLGMVTVTSVPVAAVTAPIEQRFLLITTILAAILMRLAVQMRAQMRAIRREEEALAAREESRAMADTVLNSVSAHIAILDDQGAIIGTNAAWRRFGQDNGLTCDLGGRNANYLEACRAGAAAGDATAAAAVEGISAVMAGARDEFVLDYPCHSPDRKRWFNLRVNRLSGAGGRVVVSHEDITPVKLAEQAMRDARDAAEQAVHAKADFLATMSHEIRTPMNGVIGFAEMLLGSSLTPEQRRHASNVRAAGRSLLTVLNDILDYSRLEAGKLELRSVPFDLATLASSCEDLVQPAAAEKGVEMRTLLVSGVSGYVRGDPDRVRQILLNLLANAVKFTDHGSVLLTIARLDGPHQETRFKFTISDTGVGIPEEKHALLFQRFSQIQRGRGGTGLGLAICHHLVTLMGGEIGFQSRPGLGSTFWFILPLPLCNVAAITPREEVAASLRATHPARLLVVEDVAMNKELVMAILAKAGHQADAVESGEAAIAAVQDRAYDLVLMDVHMPGMGGLAATRAIRALPAPVGGIPVLAMTAGAMPEEVEECRKAGMNEHLSKPVDQPVLLAAIERWTHGATIAPVTHPGDAAPGRAAEVA